jgi:UDP-N-acetylglucosamine--N-acetylmuramyl-(pentapeptide) pyrophosphoryl-undecaprenol N-acetylglucosamine transferase
VSDTGGAQKALRLLLTGGGTGGHLFPAIATAEHLNAKMPQSVVLFIGTRRKLDREALEHFGFTVKTIHSYGLKGKKLLELIKALLILPVSLFEAAYQIMKFKPDVVLGVGGYVTGPVVLVARLMGKPTVIHEQNSIPGLANRKLGRFVNRVCLSLPQSQGFFPAEKTVLTGNPVRRKIIDCRATRAERSGKPTLLVLGGSQGAHAINQLMVEAVRSRAADFLKLRLIHQTGSDDEQMVVEVYREAGMDHLVSAFFTDMAGIYTQADLVVSRAGATTLAEIGVVGKPAILIPYPFAADRHQEKNASWYVESGAAVVLPQDGLTSARLTDEIVSIIGDPARIVEMSSAMANLGIPDAAERIVDICLKLAQSGKS